MTDWITCTGDVVLGDVVRFTEGVFSGFRRPAKHIGDRTITAAVIRESYGRQKQQHTLTLEVIDCEGTQPIPVGTRITRKGRNIYRHGTERQRWDDEAERDEIAREKHARGDRARETRALRRETEMEIMSK